MTARTSIPCVVEGCVRFQRAKGWCSMHYDRVRRGGDIGGPMPEVASPGEGYLRTDGYVQDSVPGHPLASTNSHVLRHRRVLFDAIGGGPHACVWCGVEVDWERGRGKGISVDHRDGDRSNNDLSNLAVACHPCNSQRTRRWLGPDGWHGRLAGYTWHKCRCEPCRDAYRRYERSRQRKAA